MGASLKNKNGNGAGRGYIAQFERQVNNMFFEETCLRIVTRHKHLPYHGVAIEKRLAKIYKKIMELNSKI